MFFKKVDLRTISLTILVSWWFLVSVFRSSKPDYFDWVWLIYRGCWNAFERVAFWLAIKLVCRKKRIVWISFPVLCSHCFWIQTDERKQLVKCSKLLAEFCASAIKEQKQIFWLRNPVWFFDSPTQVLTAIQSVKADHFQVVHKPSATKIVWNVNELNALLPLDHWKGRIGFDSYSGQIKQ